MTSWRRIPLRRLGTIVGGGTPGPDEANWNGDVPFVTPPDLREVVGSLVKDTGRTLTEKGVRAGSTIVPQNSVVLSIRAPIGYVAVTAAPVAFNQGCRALVPFNDVDAQFLSYALIAAGPELQAMGRGTTFLEISASQMAAFEIPVPSFDDQRAITGYLDRETAQIDTLIAKQEQLIATLRERRASLISQLALSGFNPLADDRLPGPALGTVFTVTLGKMLDAKKEPKGDDVRLPYVRAANIQDKGLDLDDVNHMWYSPAEVARLDIRIGDLLVVEGGAVGTAVLIEQSMSGWSFQKTVNRLRSVSGWSTAWLGYVLRAYRDEGIIDLICDGSTIAHLTAEKLRALRIPSVEIPEQKRIVRELDEATAKIDTLIAKAERFIELSKERRAALITAAVTGQIEIPA